jgi:hypothetical protein
MDIPDNLIAILVPLGSFALAAFIVGAALFAKHRAQELRHHTIRLALEKGQPLPADLLDRPATHQADLPRGVKLIALGIGLSAVLGLMHKHAWPVGLILVALGIGYIVAHAVAAKGQAPGPGQG